MLSRKRKNTSSDFTSLYLLWQFQLEIHKGQTVRGPEIARKYPWMARFMRYGPWFPLELSPSLTFDRFLWPCHYFNNQAFKNRESNIFRKQHNTIMWRSCGPRQVLLKKTFRNFLSFCITFRFILTARHCIKVCSCYTQKGKDWRHCKQECVIKLR